MHLLLSLIFLLSLSYHALSIPTATRHQRHGRSFSVKRVKRSDYVAYGPVALRKAYRKFGIPTNFGANDLNDFEPLDMKHISPVAGNQATAQPDDTGIVSATSIQHDIEFVSPVTIGGQNISMDFDTGSSDMWVMNTLLPTQMQIGRTVYNPTQSKTFQKVQGGKFSITYGDSSYAFGTAGKDTVSIGGATVPNQVFGLPLDVSHTFVQDTFSNGLVGLGFSSMNTIKPGPQKTFFDNVIPSLDEPVLTARLRSDGVGEYVFGKIDHSKYNGALVNVSVDSSNGYWTFQSGQYAIGNGSMQKNTRTSIAIADTGTSLMLASPDLVDAYYDQVSGSVFANHVGGYVYPCTANLPPLSVALGDTSQATIPGSLINFSGVGKNITTGEMLCFGGLQSNQGTNMQIFGDVFLKSLFVVFDKRGPSLGFASPTS